MANTSRKSSKRGPGRPRKFKGKPARHIVSVVRQLGITKGQIALADEGIGISKPTLGKLAKAAGLSLKRGRPAKVAEPVAAKAKARSKARKPAKAKATKAVKAA